MTDRLKIGQEVLIHGYVDEIRKDTVIIRNDGGYFGTVEYEVTDIEYKPDTLDVLNKIRDEIDAIRPDDYPCNMRIPERIRDMAVEIVEKYIGDDDK